MRQVAAVHEDLVTSCAEFYLQWEKKVELAIKKNRYQELNQMQIFGDSHVHGCVCILYSETPSIGHVHNQDS